MKHLIKKNHSLIILSLLLTLAYVYAIFLSSNTHFLTYIENVAYDLRLNLTLPNQKNQQIVILDIDEKSLANEGRWPWPRDRIAHLVDLLFDHYGIAVLAFDVVFAEPDNNPGIDSLAKLAKQQLPDADAFLQNMHTLSSQINRDQQLADSFIDRPVILGYYFQNDGTMNLGLKTGQLPFPVLPVKEAGLDALPLLDAQGYGANIAILQENAIAGGFFDNPDWTSDGIIRSVPLVTAFEGNLYESLALATTRT